MEGLKTARDVVKFCEERDIELIQLWFVDILGQLKAVTITSQELSTALEEGAGIDGSSVEGFARIFESDLIAMPGTDWQQGDIFIQIQDIPLAGVSAAGLYHLQIGMYAYDSGQRVPIMVGGQMAGDRLLLEPVTVTLP